MNMNKRCRTLSRATHKLLYFKNLTRTTRLRYLEFARGILTVPSAIYPNPVSFSQRMHLLPFSQRMHPVPSTCCRLYLQPCAKIFIIKLEREDVRCRRSLFEKRACTKLQHGAPTLNYIYEWIRIIHIDGFQRR